MCGCKTGKDLTSANIEGTCKLQWYTILMLGISLLGLVLFVIIRSRKLKLFGGHLFSNEVKVMLFMSIQNTMCL